MSSSPPSPPPPSLSQELRLSTRAIHTVSDHLVNLKLGVALSNDQVWAEGLTVFYEVFKFLEEASERTRDSLLGELRVEGVMDRTAAFETDLDFYLGPEWKQKGRYRVRPEVQAYLSHLRRVEEEDPYVLIAYVYHLYMGLLSGGQILRGKRRLVRGLTLRKGEDGEDSEAASGEAVTHFTRPISVLKRRLREATDRVGEELDKETRERVIKEGVKVRNCRSEMLHQVFELNNSIISSVRGVNDIFIRKVLLFLAAFSLFAAVVGTFWFRN